MKQFTPLFLIALSLGLGVSAFFAPSVPVEMLGRFVLLGWAVLNLWLASVLRAK